MIFKRLSEDLLFFPPDVRSVIVHLYLLSKCPNGKKNLHHYFLKARSSIGTEQKVYILAEEYR